MKRLRIIALIAALCLPLTACSTVKEEKGMPKDQSYRVLFVGNSYTYFNDLWDLFTNAAESIGYTIEADHVTKGGYYLEQYTTTADAHGAQVQKFLSENTYDAVFLQEQSTCPAQDYEKFAGAVVTLDAMVRENGARTILYQTWGRQPGSPTLSALGWTHKGMTDDLIAAYDRAAQAVGATVSPVGAAFYDVHTNHTEINLYDPDTSHPSLAGSYLAAMCHLATFTGADVRDVTFDAGLGEEVAAVLREAADRAVNGENEE